MKTISTLFFSKYLKLTYISSAYLVIIDISSELKDPIHWAFALLGVLIGFGARKVDKKNNLANSNLWWSLSVSIAFTLLMTFVRESYPNITNLWYYGLTLAVSTFSPAIVGNLLTYLPSSISKAFIGLIENWINSKKKSDGT